MNRKRIPGPLAPWALVAVLAAVCLWLPLVVGLQRLPDGDQVVPSQPTTFQGPWVAVATLTGSCGTLADDARNYAAVAALADANCAIWEVPLGTNGVSFRWQIDTDANTAVVEVWTARSRYNPGDRMDDFSLAWVWTLTGGAQVGTAANVFCDTLTVTETWPAIGMVTDSGGDRICRYDVDVRGYRYLAFLRTDATAAATVIIDAAIW
jgi:hypothetical protein